VKTGRWLKLGPLNGVAHRPPLSRAPPRLAAVVPQHEFIAAAANGDAVEKRAAIKYTRRGLPALDLAIPTVPLGLSKSCTLSRVSSL